MSYARHHEKPRAVGVAILTVSDTKGPSDDASGRTILDLLVQAGHRPAGRAWCRDEIDMIRERAQDLLAAPDADALVVTGGTGVAPRDVTVEALRPLFTKELPGFGETLRSLSQKEIGSGAILSRATAGLMPCAGRSKPIFLLPGSPDACRLATERLIAPEVGHLVELANPGGARHA